MPTTTRRIRVILAVAAVAASIMGCGVAPQPESAKTTFAIEVPLPTQEDRDTFLSVLNDVAKTEGLHVDSASNEELEQQADIYKMTLRATVWRGDGDDEPISSAMDGPDHLGQVWLAFSKGEDPALNERFRVAAMREIMRRWPEALSLPIMPTGAIPLARDLVRTPQGYVVNPSEAARYGAESDTERMR
jgi:hypothetical protein